MKNDINSLSIDEKIRLLQGSTTWLTGDVDGLDKIFMADGPHGLRRQNEASMTGIYDSLQSICYPTASSISSSWNKKLAYTLGSYLASECKTQDVQLLLGPGINIKRSPLCGRNFEYFSEDPILTGKIASQMVKGLQENGVGACIKHFAMNNQEHERMSIDVNVDERTMREVYLKAFEIIVKEANPAAIMAAYNRINGSACCENKHLLKDILKDEWGFEGFVMSDWGAVNNRVEGVKAGLDLEMPTSGEYTNKRVKKALEDGMLDETEIDECVNRILNVVERLKNKDKAKWVTDYDKHHDFAIDLALESIILLKNEENILPLKKEDNLLVVGEFAKDPVFQGGGSSKVNPYKVEIPYDNMKIFSENIDFETGYLKTDYELSDKLSKSCMNKAKAAKKVIMFMGLSSSFESEGYDRKDLSLPKSQLELFEKIYEVNKNIVVVLSNGASVSMPFSKKAKAIVECFLSGEGMGMAISKILYGKISPSGKTSETFFERIEDNGSYLNFPGNFKVQYSEGLFIGYKYVDKKKIKPLFPFGFGLSYTKFDIELNKKSDIKTNVDIDKEKLSFDVTIKNTGKYDGMETVQIYLSQENSTVVKPVKQLVDFEKVYVKKGKSEKITFMLTKKDFFHYDERLETWAVESGRYKVLVGTSSVDIKAIIEVDIHSKDLEKVKFNRFTPIYRFLENEKGYKLVKPLAVKFLGYTDERIKSKKQDDMMNNAIAYYLPIGKLINISFGKFKEEDLNKLLDEYNLS